MIRKRTAAYISGTALCIIMLSACAANGKINPPAMTEIPAAVQKAKINEDVNGAAVLTLTITEIKDPRGLMSVALYNSENNYNQGRRIAGILAEVSGDKVVISYDGLPEGDYAVKLYHDVDSNGKMNTNLFGIPSEPYAFSNNAKGIMGPAPWIKSKFQIAASSNTHEISMK